MCLDASHMKSFVRRSCDFKGISFLADYSNLVTVKKYDVCFSNEKVRVAVITLCEHQKLRSLAWLFRTSSGEICLVPELSGIWVSGFCVNGICRIRESVV